MEKRRYRRDSRPELPRRLGFRRWRRTVWSGEGEARIGNGGEG